MSTEEIEKILKRIAQMDYTAEHGKVKKDYVIAYNDGLEWVLDNIFNFPPVKKPSKKSGILSCINVKARTKIKKKGVGVNYSVPGLVSFKAAN